MIILLLTLVLNDTSIVSIKLLKGMFVYISKRMFVYISKGMFVYIRIVRYCL